MMRALASDKGIHVKDVEYRIGSRGRPGGSSPITFVGIMARRIGIALIHRSTCTSTSPSM